MLCPKCSGKSTVADSRLTADKSVRRKRVCQKCKHIYRTLEVLETSKPTATKPKPEQPKPLKKNWKYKKKRLRTKPKPQKVFKYTEADIDNLTDEELEEAMASGTIRFDEDEL